MRLLLPATLACLLAAPLILTASLVLTAPALADYKMAEERLQAGDVAGAMPLLAEEAKLGNPVAAFNLAKIYEDGSGGVTDFAAAATYYKIAAEIDTAPRYNGAALGAQGAELIVAAQKYGQFALGRLYEAGQGVPRDPGEAVFWYTRAADLGLQQAMLKLAVIYQEGLPGAADDPGIAADPAKAVPWLEQAAAQGNVAAMNELGRAYLAGAGVLANARVAAEWFGKAADAGSITADYSLGSIYRIGFGGQPDFIRAVRHFERAASSKESASMVALGDLHANGEGVPADKVQALTWYKLAALYGQAEGGKRGEALAATMSAEEQAQARLRAETWIPGGDAAPGLAGAAKAATADPASGVPLHTGGDVLPAAATVTAPTPTPAASPAAEPVSEPAPAAAAIPVPGVVELPAADPDAPVARPLSTPTATEWAAPTEPAATGAMPADALPVGEAPEPFDPFAPDPFEPLPPLPDGAPEGARPFVPQP